MFGAAESEGLDRPVVTHPELFCGTTVVFVDMLLMHWMPVWSFEKDKQDENREMGKIENHVKVEQSLANHCEKSNIKIKKY